MIKNKILEKENNKKNKENYLGIDPGSFKTGLALVDSKGQILKQKTVLTKDLERELNVFFANGHLPKLVVMGDGTFSMNIQSTLNKILVDIKVYLVNEKNSTLEARNLYWKLNKRVWWRHIIPLGLQTPPEAIDGYAAAILVKRFITKK